PGVPVVNAVVAVAVVVVARPHRDVSPIGPLDEGRDVVVVRVAHRADVVQLLGLGGDVPMRDLDALVALTTARDGPDDDLPLLRVDDDSLVLLPTPPPVDVELQELSVDPVLAVRLDAFLVRTQVGSLAARTARPGLAAYGIAAAAAASLARAAAARIRAAGARAAAASSSACAAHGIAAAS